MGSFCAEMRQECAALWEAQLRHPFVVGLAAGTLPRDRFQFYIVQDALFLTSLAHTFAFAATKTADPARIVRLGEMCVETVQVERALHEMYAARFGMTTAAMAAMTMAPTNYAYTRHMLTIGATGSLAEVATAVLPCAWIYAVVGQHFTARGEPPAEHAYRDWLLAYATPDFDRVGAWLRDVVDDEATRLDAGARQRLRNIFRTSSQYEYLFWEMAWKGEGWPAGSG